MNADMIDPRDITEKCLMTGAESRALKHLADELRLSKSKVLLLAFLKYARDFHDEEHRREKGLTHRPELGQD